MKSTLIVIGVVLSITAAAAPLSAKPIVTDGDVPADSGFRAVTLAGGLEHPWGMDWLPNGDMLITERPGRLRLLKQGRLVPAPVAGVAEVFAAGQGGLLDVRIHPGFTENRLVYFTYAHGQTTANRTRVARAVYTGAGLTDWQVVFEVPESKFGRQHFGARLLWLPDGTMLVSIGDGGNPPIRMNGDWIRAQAQKRDSHLGKILRLNDDGTIPSDNPFSSDKNAAAAVYSYGHRNIQGLAYDPLRAIVWSSEHGALGGDELNVIRPGANYGWPAVTYSREYFDGSKISEATAMPGMVDPRVVWISAIAPSGLTVYTAARFPGWQGDVFVGGLKSQDIRRIKLDDAGRVIDQHAIRIGQRVRDVRQGPDGLLYVLTDETDGSLIRLEPTADRAASEPP
jgi:glucose/arabinose dehydrogenase